MAGPKNSTHGVMGVADSNVYLRLLLGDVASQSERAIDWLSRQPESSVLVVDAVLVEVLFLLESKRAYGLKRADFMPELMRLLSGLPWYMHPLTAAALERFTASRLDFVDCLLLAMHEMGGTSEVATFDKALLKALGNTVV